MKKTLTGLNPITKIVVCLVSTAALFSCSGLSSGDAANPLTISGNLSLSAASQSIGNQKIQKAGVPEESISILSTDLTLYTVTCATATTPILTGTGSVAADGTFSVDIIGGAGQPISCYLVTGSGDNAERAADFLISDATQTDLNGDNQVTGTAVFNGDANMGTIDFDPNSGEVTVPASNLAGVIDTGIPLSADLFDPTGSWTIGAVDFTLPAGVEGPCAGGGGGGGGNECNGPPGGQTIYLKLWKGIKTADSSDIYGLQVWDSPSQFSTCGSKIGLTSAIKSQIGVDFSANGAADDVFSFASSVSNFFDPIASATGTVNLTDNWKMDTATAQYNINPSCGPHDVTIGGITYSNAWVCGPDSSTYYQVQLGGGCVDASNNPVQLNDWSGISCGSMAEDGDGIKTVSCSGNANIDGATVAVTCNNKWAVTNASYVVQAAANFNWSDLNASQISSGSLCSSIPTGSTAGQIAQLQCYANYFWQSRFDRESGACLPRVDMDWSATTPANFAIVDQIRPNGLVFFEQFRPFADGSGGSMVTRQEHYNGVQVNGNNWVNCRVIDVGALTVKKIAADKMIATYQSSEVSTSTSKPACMAAFTGSRKTFVFYLTK